MSLAIYYTERQYDTELCHTVLIVDVFKTSSTVRHDPAGVWLLSVLGALPCRRLPAAVAVSRAERCLVPLPPWPRARRLGLGRRSAPKLRAPASVGCTPGARRVARATHGLTPPRGASCSIQAATPHIRGEHATRGLYIAEHEKSARHAGFAAGFTARCATFCGRGPVSCDKPQKSRKKRSAGWTRMIRFVACDIPRPIATMLLHGQPADAKFPSPPQRSIEVDHASRTKTIDKALKLHWLASAGYWACNLQTF